MGNRKRNLHLHIWHNFIMAHILVLLWHTRTREGGGRETTQIAETTTKCTQAEMQNQKVVYNIAHCIDHKI